MKYLKSLLGSLLICAVAQAAAPSKESVEKLLAATNVEKQFLGMQAQVEGLTRSAIEQALQGQTLTPEAQQLLETKRQKTVAEFKQEANWAGIKDLYVQIYIENFSQDEVDGLTAFYQSPAGQAFMQKMPLVMQKASGVMQQRMKPTMIKLQQSLKDATEEAKGSAKKPDTPTFTLPTTPPKG
jgi:uncharacterized protein